MKFVTKLNEKGVLPAIFGLSYILAGVIVLAIIALAWLFWKPLFVFAVAIAVIYFGLAVIPQMVKGKEGLKYAAVATATGFLIMLFALYVPISFSIFQAGADAPLTGEITFDKQQVLVGEPLTATFNGG